MQTGTFDELEQKKTDQKDFGAFLAHFFDFLKQQKITNLQWQKPPKNFQDGFYTMVGGLKYQEMIKTQLLRRPAPRKVHKRKYKSLFESRGQNDPPLGN